MGGTEMILRGHTSKMIGLLALCLGIAAAQSVKAPSVSIAPIPLVTAPRAAQTMVDLNFRVASGFHINSNTPKSEFLIPTNLRMDLPTDIILGKIQYPAGKDLAFPFSPDEKLNVYSGDFTIGSRPPAARGGAGKICDARRPALPSLR
jgi:hypothetical protein